MRKGKIAKAVLAIGLSGAMLAGCGSSSSSSASASAASGVAADNEEGEKITLNFINHTSEQAKIDWEDYCIELFEKAHPNVTIATQRMSMDNYTQTIATKFASDDAPDLFYEDSATLPTYVKNGYVTDLSDTEAVSNLRDGAADALTVDGKVYAVPMVANEYVVTYNKKAFEAAGIDAVPTTQEELYEDCEKLEAAGITPFALGYSEGWVLKGDIQTDYVNNWLTQDADAISKMESRETKFADSEYWKGALERIAQRTKYGPENPFGTDWTTACTSLVNGEAAMILNGDWTASNAASYGDISDFGAFPLPISDNASDLTLAGLAGGQGICVSSSTKYADLCKEFVNITTSADSAKYYLEHCAEIVLTKDADFSNSQGTVQDIEKYLNDSTITKNYGGQVNFSNEYFDALQSCISSFLLDGGTDVDGALKNIDSEFDRIASAS